jgi:ferredoxin
MSEYKITADRKKCIGAGFCEKLSPELFSLDEDNKVVLKKSDIGKDQLKEAVTAAKVCPSYAIDVIKTKKGKSVLDIEPEKHLKVKLIKAYYDSKKEWVMDKKGFFTIKPFPDEGLIRVRHYNAKHQLTSLIEGKNAEEIYNTICREKLLSDINHAAYLGSELQKAEVAMRKNLSYIQDDTI